MAQKTPGVVIQAHAVSQILSATLDKRPLLWYLPEWGEGVWIVIVSGLGGWAAVGLPGPRARAGAGLAAIAMLTGGGYVVLWLSGGWLPLVPAGIGAIATWGTVTVLQRLGTHE